MTGPRRPSPGRWSASGSRYRPHGHCRTSERGPGDLPNLTGALRQGEITFDKLRAVADVATPETERELLDAARECSVRQLAELAGARRCVPKRGSGAEQHDRRFLRFNDRFRTISMQLPPDSYAEAKAAIEAQAKEIPSDGETPWDQRCCDAFMEKIRSSWGTNTTASPYFVVVHTPLAALVDDAGESTELAGELEHHGLIDCDVVQRIACDATIAVGVDTTSATPCTRAGPNASQPRPNEERSSGAIAIAVSAAVPT